jgi:hypothetical protein
MRRRNRRILTLKRKIRRREEEKRSGVEIKLKKDIKKNPWSCISSVHLTSVGKVYNTSRLFHFS